MSAPKTSLLSRAFDTLNAAAPDDTIVVATMNPSGMVMHTYAIGGPAGLLHIARRLLDEVVNRLIEIEAAAPDDETGDDAADLRIQVEDALAALPPEDDEAAP